MKRPGPVLIAVSIPIVAGVFALHPPLLQLLYCEESAIDISSGRIRERTRIAGFTVRCRVTESWLSMCVEPMGEPAWHPVYTSSPGLPWSPHYRFHGAITDLKAAETVFHMFGLGPVEQREIGSRILRLWQENLRDDAAGKYLNDLMESLHREQKREAEAEQPAGADPAGSGDAQP